MNFKQLKEMMALNEARIYEQNFIKIKVVETELNRIFGRDEAPKVDFDDDGLYFQMDKFQYAEFERLGGFKKFRIAEGDTVDKNKQIKNYYVEMTEKVQPTEQPAEGEEEIPAEETTNLPA